MTFNPLVESKPLRLALLKVPSRFRAAPVELPKELYVEILYMQLLTGDLAELSLAAD